MTKELEDALNRLDSAWAKDQTKHYSEMFMAITGVLQAWNACKLDRPLQKHKKAGNMKSGNYSLTS